MNLKIGGIIVLLLLVASPLASAHPINMEALCQIESGCKDDAVSFRGAKYGRGRYQISEIVLKHFKEVDPYPDWFFRSDSAPAGYLFKETVNMSASDLHNENVSLVIANWYLDWIDNALRINGIEPTVEKVLACWNFGYGNVLRGKRLPKETKDFIKKYEELAGK